MARFLKDFSKKFKDFSYPKPIFKNNCENTKIEQTVSQKLYKEIIKPELEETRKEGLLIYAGTGFGKTLSALLIAKNYKEYGYTIIYVTRTTLKDNISKDLEKANISKDEIINCSYKQFSNIFIKKGEVYKKLEKRKTNRILDNCLVIVDEAHKIFGKNLKTQEMHNVDNFVKLLKSGYLSEKFKLVLMTATPIEKDPMEGIKLLNLLFPENIFPEERKEFEKIYLNEFGTFTKEGSNMFSEKIQGIVSYVDTTKDITRFPQVSISVIPVNISQNTIKSIKKDCKINLI
jgi:superfamily II DNA or RNA helicase